LKLLSVLLLAISQLVNWLIQKVWVDMNETIIKVNCCGSSVSQWKK